MSYRFPYVGDDLRSTSPQPDTSSHCETADTGSRDVPVHSHNFRWVLISATYGGMARAA